MANDPGFVALARVDGALEAAFDDRELRAVSFESVEAILQGSGQSQPRACVIGGGEDDLSAARVERLRSALPLTDVLVWHPEASASFVRAVLGAGATDVVLSADVDAVVARVEGVVGEQLLLPRVLGRRGTEHSSYCFEGLLSRSRRMWDLFETCQATAPTDATVLILGETGTGKELIARAIHRNSNREGRFVAVNCGAVPESLIDAQLFGHVRGAFTGADRDEEGLFRHAEGGTLFLDEIGNIPLAAQYRLLRALQEGTVRPVGGQEEIPVDARTIAATSSPLDEQVRRQAFREDLLYRLDVIRIVVPPLRERSEDIVFLFAHFLKEHAEHYRLERPELSDSFLDALEAFDWPGNVRQLENLAERVLLTHQGQRLTSRHFRRLTTPYQGRTPEERAFDAAGAADRPSLELRAPADGEMDTDRPLAEVLEEATEALERSYLEACLRQNHGRMATSAAQAGISRRTLLRKLGRLGIDRRRFRSG